MISPPNSAQIPIKDGMGSFKTTLSSLLGKRDSSLSLPKEEFVRKHGSLREESLPKT